jgi:hypothetical protein
MKTSTTKMIAIIATAAGLLMTSTTLAKGPSKSGGNNGARMSSMHSTSSGKSAGSFQLSNKNFSGSAMSSKKLSSSPLSSKKFTSSQLGINQINNKKNLSQTFKKQDFNKDKFKNGGINVVLGNKFDKFDKLKNGKNSKDFLFKKDNCWFDWCYPKKNYCFPNYFGCYPSYGCYYPLYSCYPTYNCYDYGTPTYISNNYNSSITQLTNAEPSRTRVAVGSVLMVNGQAFGDKAGGARLRVSGMAMPIEVLEWTPAAVKVRLPQVEITGVTPAEIEVFRGDGSLASKTAVELTASSEQLALGR